MKSLALAAFVFMSASSMTVADESRAKIIVDWLAKGQYFESPIPIAEKGIQPKQIRITSGVTIELPKTPSSGQRERYWRELEKQADILSMTGSDSVPFLLKSLRHEDFFVRVIVAMALDRILNVSYLDRVGVLFRPGNKELGEDVTSVVVDEEVIERVLLSKYVERASIAFPEQKNPQQAVDGNPH